MLAKEIIGRYPTARSRRLIPLLHLAQEQDGYVTDDAMKHIGELVGVTPAEVLGTARSTRCSSSSRSASTYQHLQQRCRARCSAPTS